MNYQRGHRRKRITEERHRERITKGQRRERIIKRAPSQMNYQGAANDLSKERRHIA